jgi:hypothetical protein
MSLCGFGFGLKHAFQDRIAALGSTSGSSCFLGVFAMAEMMFKAGYDLPATMVREIGRVIVRFA